MGLDNIFLGVPYIEAGIWLASAHGGGTLVAHQTSVAVAEPLIIFGYGRIQQYMAFGISNSIMHCSGPPDSIPRANLQICKAPRLYPTTSRRSCGSSSSNEHKYGAKWSFSLLCSVSIEGTMQVLYQPETRMLMKDQNISR